MGNLKLTRDGLKKLNKTLEEKKEELRKLGQYKSQAAANEGDGWHDNFAFEQTEIKERGLIRQINELQANINSAEIIQEDSTVSSDIVKVGSKVTVSMQFPGEGPEELHFVLTGNYGDTSFEYVSINSPIGKCIINKKVGYEGKYIANGNTISVKILDIGN